MFTQTWRAQWGLTADPFACEDADKDVVLGEIEMAAVHSGFDRVFGDPRAPSPGIVFGEKGSGKSGLRLMMKRRLEAHNAEHPEARVFTVEYVDFDPYIDAASRGRGRKPSPPDEVVSRWSVADHLDAILSLAVTRLVDGILEQPYEPSELPRKQRLDLALLTALYYRGQGRTATEALDELRQRLALPSGPPGTAKRVLLTLVGLGLLAVPHLVETRPGLEALAFLSDARLGVWAAGLVVALGPWVLEAYRRRRRGQRAARIARAIRVLPDDPAPLAAVLATLTETEQGEFVLPEDGGDAPRYELLARLLGLLEAHGNRGLYVLMDRVDEPTLLNDSSHRMRDFVARILDIKLLQHPRLALKMFLPIEMESLWRNASPEQLKRMRLDKSNLVPELKWTGRELYEIANQRLRACLADGRRHGLDELFGDDLDTDHVLETFSVLGTPRYAFGFLSEVFLQYVKDLPDDLPEGDPRWRLPRAPFDVVRASWIDRAGVLRRTLN